MFFLFRDIQQHFQTHPNPKIYPTHFPEMSQIRAAAGEGRRRATEARLASSEPFATRRFEQSGYAKKHSYHFCPPVPDQT